ncbi:MAG: coniferyl-alcohol dehydrogenase [Sphingomonadales bacterium]
MNGGDLLGLAGKTIAVTGSASGIGAETATRMRALGARVIGLDRTDRRDNVDDFIALDLLDAAAIDAAAAALPAELDGLCNIAGVPPRGDALAVLKVNFFSARRFTQRALPRLRDGATIVNVASMAGFKWRLNIERVKAGLALNDNADDHAIRALCASHGIDAVGSYLYSKELMIAWTKTLRQQLSIRRIRALSISPGPVETPIFGDFVTAFGAKATQDIGAVGRPGKPADIAPVIAFLCSDAAGWLNGIDVPADGGLEAVMLSRAFGLD